jgi:hypothetical protein
MRRLRRLLIAVGAVAGVAALLYLSLFLRSPVERPFAYWTIDDLSLLVVVLDAPDLACEARVEESDDSVRIHAVCHERVVPVSQTGMARKYVLEVRLHAPLGNRSIYDGIGTLATACGDPPPDCIAP